MDMNRAVSTRDREGSPRCRPPGSASKLRTYYDGFRILKLILVLVKEERPLQFFSLISAIMAFIALVLAWPVLMTFLATGLVPRLPTAVLSTGLMLLAFLSLTCGLILETVTRGRREIKRMQYLRVPAPGVRALARDALGRDALGRDVPAGDTPTSDNGNGR